MRIGNFPVIVVLVAGIPAAFWGCTSTLSESERPETLSSLPADGSASVEDYVLVSCKLPGSVRQLGTRAVFVAPRRPEMLTRRECGLRGGEFVLFDRSDYRAALNELLPQARAGNPVAQSYVGEIYEKGLGLPASDPAEAASWYRKAAQQGDIAAQVALGSLYERGLGLPVDKAEALNWYRRASGIVDDPVQFSSAFAAERKQLRQEIAKRQQVIAQLKARPSPSSTKQLAAQKRDATSRAQHLTQRANAARSQKQAVAQQANAGPAAAQAALQAKVERLEKLELAYREDSDLMFEAAQVAGVQ